MKSLIIRTLVIVFAVNASLVEPFYGQEQLMKEAPAEFFTAIKNIHEYRDRIKFYYDNRSEFNKKDFLKTVQIAKNAIEGFYQAAIDIAQEANLNQINQIQTILQGAQKATDEATSLFLKMFPKTDQSN